MGHPAYDKSFLFVTDFDEFLWAYVKFSLINILFESFVDSCLRVRDKPQSVTFFLVFFP